MGDVHSRRTPPFPSPTETLSPIAVPPPHHLQTPQSPGYRVPNHDRAGLRSTEGTTDGRDGSATAARKPRLSRGDSADQLAGLTPLPDETRAGNDRQEDQGRSSQTLKELRRQMEELLVYQQMQQHHHQHQPSGPPAGSGNLHETPRKRRLSNTSTSELPPAGSNPASGSVDSAGTIKGVDTPTSPRPPVDQTPSYPFPRVPNHAKPSLEQTGRQGQFRLKLPSEKIPASVPQQTRKPSVSATETRNVQPTFQPPDHKDIPEDPSFPSPSLYDLTLKLNADAGLDAWWSNLVDILQMQYGAERASLAVPGDTTDLENVPWGQKAIFDQTCPEVVQSACLPEDPPAKKTGEGVVEKARETPSNPPKATPAGSVNRPHLASRHSFAGFGHDIKPHAPQQAPLQTSKNTTSKPEKKQARIVEKPKVVDPSPLATNDNRSLSQKEANELPASPGSLQRAVFPIPRPLEVEPDPLIKRTGVVKLFGRANPVVLTREYSRDSVRTPHHAAQSPFETVQKTPNAEDVDALVPAVTDPAPAKLSAPGLREYDEYEQVPQSPWSQSPAPSPAPRTQAEQNPFFNNHAVDEGAFEKNPPPHDYSNTHPLEAIGVDKAKTVIHIPLLHRGRFHENPSSTLRFPVAIISLVSTIVPYPSTLRQSLTHLMPHLTTSFCLAQQYSQLERQLTSKVETPRYGHLLGLGGTFSDASSELELVAGLSGHVSYSVGDEHSMSTRASIASPSDRSSTKFSPAMSNFGTPAVELGHVGFSSKTHSPAIGSRLADNTDSYFNVQQSKGSRDSAPQPLHGRSKSKANITSSTPTSPSKVTVKAPTGEESNLQDPALVVASPLQEMRPPPVVSPTQPSSRQTSTNSFYAQLQREMPRPFSDTIAQLMLNSVPLHLFLAKPQTGEVIWTNTKFDAYRRSKPQEQKLRDPWQNIHSSERDHVASEWENALRTGSQFTERVRVKRFNDESAYRWFIFRANPLLSSTGEVLYWIGSFLDIHEQHIAELKATQEREKFATDAKYRAFSNSIPQVVFEATENRGLIFVNEQWNLYTGQSLEEALNLGFAKHVHPADLSRCGGLSMPTSQGQGPNSVKATESTPAGADSGRPRSSSESHGVSSALDELVRRGVATLQKDENGRVFYSTEIRLSSRGGEFRWHLVRLVRVETSSFGSEEASWYGTCTDINDRKNLERELNKAMSQLNNQMESKTKFFSNMSHEIRTPLNGILGTIPFILDTQLDSDQRRMLDTIQNSSTNLRELVDNILDVSRVEAGKMSMVNSWFHVRSMIEDVIDTIASRAIDKGLEINYLMAADVPSMVIGDRFRIRQVLINLVGNAVKFTAQGEIYICCNLFHDASANLKDTEALMNFDVVDTGKGFSSQDAERLMQRFSQLGESGSQQHAGSGLGLFLSKQLVEMHGGKLTPSSTEGHGAKFSFNVKVDAPPPPSPSDRPRLLRQASKATRRPGTSRTTSYDQSNTRPPKSWDSKLQDPALLSPGMDSPDSGGTKGLSPGSAASSALPTPDISSAHLSGFDHAKTLPEEKQPPSGQNQVSSGRSVSPGKPSTEPVAPMSLDSFSIVILCPLDYTRRATKQHIEQVVPHEIPFTITTLPDLDEWKDKKQSGSSAQCTHLVLNLPATDEILEVIQHVSETDASTAPVVVIISDLYQKRQISTRVKELAASGKKVFIVPKPVKPSAFSTIFDPDSKRELSKDRNQDMAREINNNFKTVSKMVKEVLGNKGYRILLVEDDETNRDVSTSFLLFGIMWHANHHIGHVEISGQDQADVGDCVQWTRVY